MSFKNIKAMKAERGFTIVELLIVVVIIGILAAIVVVAYTGVTNRAKVSKAQAAASTVADKAEAYNALVGNYPIATDTTHGFPTASPADTSVSLSGSGITMSTLSNATPWTAPANENVVEVNVCSTTAALNTGMRIYYWDYASTASAKRTLMKTIGTCGTWPATTLSVAQLN